MSQQDSVTREERMAAAKAEGPPTDDDFRWLLKEFTKDVESLCKETDLYKRLDIYGAMRMDADILKRWGDGGRAEVLKKIEEKEKAEQERRERGGLA
ncbi:hypothetical protein V7793_30820 [Streptomyces sp. KLMMK]|uniref:hypothetical protein n=1 Tax=Streptomyces sp. KLMMK TaxID=3109353 RepID=UPI0030097F8E